MARRRDRNASARVRAAGLLLILMPIVPPIKAPPVPVVKQTARLEALAPDVNPALIRRFFQMGGNLRLLPGMPRGNGYYSLPYAMMNTPVPNPGMRSARNVWHQRRAPLELGRLSGPWSGRNNTLLLAVPQRDVTQTAGHELYHFYQRANPLMRTLSVLPGAVPWLNQRLVERPAYGSRWQVPVGPRYRR